MSLLAARLSDPGAQRILFMLGDAGHEALFVGGTVRNALLGASVTDFDIATAARPDEVLRLAAEAGIRAVPTGIEHGTITLVHDHVPYEVTTFRRDVDTDGRHAQVVFSDNVAEDAARRDFTMNALYATADGRLVDPLGGRADLDDRVVRFIGAPEDRIREDFLRILRFFRFTAWYGDPNKGMEAEGLAACAALAEGLSRLSAERVTTELVKLLAAPDPAPAVAAMAQTGILQRVVPGAMATSLAPLVYLERSAAVAPSPLRRLVALGGDTGGLRLSKAQQRALSALRAGVAATAPALELGYRHGPEMALDILLSRSAALGGPLDPGAKEAVRRGSEQVFPVSAADLPDDLQGPAIGAALSRLEQVWLSSDCRLSREALLAQL